MSVPELTALREAVAASEAMAAHLERLRIGLADRFPVDARTVVGDDHDVERFHAWANLNGLLSMHRQAVAHVRQEGLLS